MFLCVDVGGGGERVGFEMEMRACKTLPVPRLATVVWGEGEERGEEGEKDCL